MNELTKRTEVLRCLDCDALLIDANNKETDACYRTNCDSFGALICKNCGSLAGVVDKDGKVTSTEDINTLEYIIMAGMTGKALEENNISLEDVMSQYKADKETQKPIKFEDIFNNASRPVPLKETPKDISIKSLISTKYILLSKGHDSWKIFDSEEELLSELSKMPYNTDMLIYELGEEKKVKYNVSLA